MTGQLLARARAGDGDAFAELIEPFRRELHVHCYRILGSVADAEDVLQETLMAAWRGLDQFQGRAPMRAWLYRIATNKSLNALRATRARPLPAPASPLPEPTRHGEPLWLEPYPDILLGELPDQAPGPEARYEAREAVSLAFLAALQYLPPMQRAALILRDVLGFRAAEAAETLECTVDTVNGLLKRARANLTRQLPPGGREWSPLPGSAREHEIVSRFTDAYQRSDIGAIVALLTDDAALTMPPLPLEYHGRAAVAGFLAAICGTRHFTLIPTRANGQPAFGCYLYDDTAPIARAHGLLVLTITGDRIAAVTRFLDNSVLSHFGLPRLLPTAAGGLRRHGVPATPDPD
jgi:RNA polymerase sigma-70 factor (ECF subfamily)